MSGYDRYAKEIIDEMKLLQDLVTGGKTSPLQMKILLKKKFYTILENFDELLAASPQDSSKLIEILEYIANIEFKKPAETSEILWMNIYFMRLQVIRILMDQHYSGKFLGTNYTKVLSSMLNVPKKITIQEIYEEDEQLAFRLTRENFQLLTLIINNLESEKIYSYKEWLNTSLANHQSLIHHLRNQYSLMNYAQKNNFKDVAFTLTTFTETIRLFLTLYSKIRNHKYLLEPSDLFNPVDDFQFISAIIRFKEELDGMVKGIADFRDDPAIDFAMHNYEDFTLIPNILYHVRELIISDYSDSKLISFCKNDISKVLEFLDKHEMPVNEISASNLQYFIYITGLLGVHEKDDTQLDALATKIKPFFSDEMKQTYHKVYGHYIQSKLAIACKVRNREKVGEIGNEILEFSKFLRVKDRHFVAYQILGTLAKLSNGSLNEAEFNEWKDNILSLSGDFSKNELLLDEIQAYMKTLSSIISGEVAQYNLKKLNNPDPFDPAVNLIPNFTCIEDKNILYIPFNIAADSVY
ncbi:MAG: hypothetical protein INQ03_24070 [Candidatus Heimdallarchaeota archaeon]|nr:hypothetical protein [Candidatus Heimdallarchaeota archaeon]